VHRICELNPQALDSGGCSDRKLNKTTSSQVLLILLTLMEKSTRLVDANVDTRKENQDHQNSSDEVEDLSFFSGLDYI